MKSLPSDSDGHPPNLTLRSHADVKVKGNLHESDGHPPNLTLRSHADVKIKGNQCMSRGYFAINSPVINNFLNNILPQMHRLFFADNRYAKYI